MEFEIRSLRLRKKSYSKKSDKLLFRQLVKFCGKEKIPIRLDYHHNDDHGIYIAGKYARLNFLGLWRYLYKNELHSELQNFILFLLIHGYENDLQYRYQILDLYEINYEFFDLFVKLGGGQITIMYFIDDFIIWGKYLDILIRLFKIFRPKWEEIKELIDEISIDKDDIDDSDDEKISIGKIYERIEYLKSLI
jgi:hypothetical protein